MSSSNAFIASFSIVLISHVLCELYLSKLVPKNKPNLQLRFWSRAVSDIAISVLVGIIGYMAVSALRSAGFKGLAWVIAIVPGALLIYMSFLLQGTNTILERSAGVGCFDLVFSALGKKK